MSRSNFRSHVNEKKVTQIAARLLVLRGGKMSHLKLMKLMWLVERTALHRWGFSVTHDSYCIMDHGMVLSSTLNLINEQRLPESYWMQHITAPKNYEVKLRYEPDFKELSKAEESLIREIFDEHGHKNRWALRDEAHDLPEWYDPNNTSIPVDHEYLLKKMGKGQDEIKEILSDMEDGCEAERVLG